MIKKMKNIFNAVIIFILLLMFYSTICQAAAIENTASGNWNDAGIWNTGTVPTAVDDVTIKAGYTVTINVNNATCLSLNVTNIQESNAVLQFSQTVTTALTTYGAITVTGQLLLVTNGGAITLTCPGISNSGTLTLDANQITDTITINLKASLQQPYIENSKYFTISGFNSSNKNCVIQTDSGSGLKGYVNCSATSTIAFSNAQFKNLGGVADVTKYGVCISGFNGWNNFGSLVIQNCDFNNYWAGLTLYNCDYIVPWFNNYVSNNSCYGNLHGGIYLLSTKRCEITNNTCYNNSGANTGWGIYLESSEMNRIESNQCYSNKLHGIYLKSSHKNILEKNTIHDQETQDGIYLYNAQYNVLIENTSYSNFVHGITLDLSSNNIMVKNASYSNQTGGMRVRYSSNSDIFIGNKSYNNTNASDKGTGLSSYASIYTLCVDETYGNNGTTKQANLKGDIFIEGEQDEGFISQIWMRNCLLDSDTELTDTSDKQEFTKVDSWIISQKHDNTNGLTKIYGQFSLPQSGLPQGTISTIKWNYSDNSYEQVATTPYLRFDDSADLGITSITPSATTKTECWIVTYSTGTNTWTVRGTTSGIQTNKVIPDTDYTSDGGEVRFRITQHQTPVNNIQYIFVTLAPSNDTTTQKTVKFCDFTDPNYIGARFKANSGSTVEIDGNSSGTPTIFNHENVSATDFYYDFELSGTTTKLNYATFKYLKQSGLVINVAPSANTKSLSIENVQSGGTHVYFGGITHTFDNINLDNTGTYNSSGTATVTFRDYTRYNLSDASGVSATWDPTLSWTGQSNFTSDGINPDGAEPNSNFEFRVKYTDKGVATGGDAPDSNIVQVWIDLDDDNSFESNEKFDMTKVTEVGVNDGDYTNGEIYSYTYEKMQFAGDGNLKYRFYATSQNSTTYISGSPNHEATGSGTTSDGLGTPTNGVAYFSLTTSAPQATVNTPSGELSGDVTITYSLIDNESNICSVTCEYSKDNGVTWSAATKGIGGESITGLTSSTSGVTHTYIWDTKTDLPDQIVTVKFKITPNDGMAGTAGTSNSFTVVNTASASKSTVVCNPSSVASDGTSTTTVTITLKDPSENPVPNKHVTISVSGSNNTVTQPSAVTDANGQTLAFIASTKAELKTVTATVTDDSIEITQQGTVTFTALAVDAAKATITVTPAEAVADGTSIATITITLQDRYNNPVSAKQVSISVSGSENTITQPSSATNANGQTTATLASTKMETKTITATDTTDSITLSKTCSIVFVPTSGLAVDNNTLVPGDPQKQNISIYYSNPDRLDTTFKIFNLTGALVYEKEIPANNVATWDGKDSDGDMVETGIYIYQLEIGTTIKNGSIVVIK